MQLKVDEETDAPRYAAVFRIRRLGWEKQRAGVAGAQQPIGGDFKQVLMQGGQGLAAQLAPRNRVTRRR